MSLLVAPWQAHRKDVSFCCNSSHVAIAVKSMVMVFRAEKSGLVFEFSVQAGNGSQVPLLAFNDSPYSDELILAAYTKESIAIISCDRRQVVFQADTGGEYLAWNRVSRSSFYYFSVDRVLEHWVLDLNANPIAARVDWQTEFSSPPMRMVICPMAPASFFVLTLDGTVYHYARSAPNNPARLIRPIVCEKENETIVDIAATNMEFIVIITQHAIGLYHIFKFELVWILRLDKTSVGFMRVVSHSNYSKYIFALMENRQFYALKFSRKKKGFEFRNVFAFHAFSTNFIRSFSVFGDNFIFFTTDMRLNVVAYNEKRDRFSVVWLYGIPMFSMKLMPSVNEKYLAYLGDDHSIQVLNSKTLQYLRSYRYESSVVGLTLLKQKCVFVTETDVFLLSLETNAITRVLSYSDIFPKRLCARFADMKTCGDLVFVRLNEYTIVKVSIENPKYEYHSFPSIVDYQVVADPKAEFYLFLQTQEGAVDVVSSNWKVVCSYEMVLSKVAGYVNIQGDIGVYLKSGTIMFNDHNVVLCECQKVLFAANSLIIQTADAVLFYRYENDFFFVDSWAEKNTTLISFNGEDIVYLTRDGYLKIRSITDTPARKITHTVNWPWDGFLEKSWLKHTLTIFCETLSCLVPVPDDVTEIRFFFDREQEPYRLAQGENPDRMYRNLFLCCAGIPLSESQREMFTECAKSWELDRRFTNAALMYHFLKEHRRAAECLIEMRSFELGIYYALCHNFEDLAHKGTLKYAIEKAKRGETVLAAAMAMRVGEFHIALHLLCEKQLYTHMNSVISRAGSVTPTEHLDLTMPGGKPIRPLQEIIDEVEAHS